MNEGNRRIDLIKKINELRIEVEKLKYRIEVIYYFVLIVGGWTLIKYTVKGIIVLINWLQ